MFSEHLVECQVLVGISLYVVGLFFFYTSLYSRSTVCTRICISRLEVTCPTVVIDRRESQPVSNFYIKVKVPGELVRFSCGMISVRNGVQIVQVRAVHPSAITVGYQVAVFIVWAIPREHCIFSSIIILGIIRIFHRTGYVRFDSQP